MALLAKLEDLLAKPGALSRRSFLGKAVTGCAILTATAAGVAANPLAAYGCTYYACCCLAHYPPNWCGSQVYSCPCDGSTPYTWVCCCSGGLEYVCGECDSCNCSFAYALGTSPGATHPALAKFEAGSVPDQAATIPQK